MHTKASIRYIAAALLLIVSAYGTAGHAQSSSPACTDSAISNSNGNVIRMRSGQTFQMFPGMGGRTASWLAGDEVSLCRVAGKTFEITNLDRNNQVVKAPRN
jgi:hypothetical protein